MPTEGFFMEKPTKTLPEKEKALEHRQDRRHKVIEDLKQLRTSVSNFANFVPKVLMYFEQACKEFKIGQAFYRLD